MSKFLTLMFALLIPALAVAEEPVQATEDAPAPKLCLVSTTLDDGGEHTLTNVHEGAQLLMGQRGSVKLTLQYETRTSGRCDEVALELPAEGTMADATIKVGESVMIVANAGVMSHSGGRLVVVGDSLRTEHASAPQS